MSAIRAFLIKIRPPFKAKRPISLALLVIGTFALTAAVPYVFIRDGDPTTRAEGPFDQPPRQAEPTVIDPDDTSVTPVPGAIPDPAIPFWYIPHINADRMKEPFRGTLSGIEIDPDFVDHRTALDVCPPKGFESPHPALLKEAVESPGPLSINSRTMPTGLASQGIPMAFTCDGELAFTEWGFSVAPGTEGANPGGGTILVTRSKGLHPISQRAPADRWSEASVNGFAAIVAGPDVTAAGGQFGSCHLAAYDREHDVLTTVAGSASNAELCIAVAEGVLR